MKTKIWLSPPHMSGHEQKYIKEAFDTNWVAPLGPNVDGFEKELAGYLETPHIAALSSGTAAIHLALILLNISRGDEVMVSSFTFSASANPVVYLGATPVFIDSERATWNMDPELLEEAIKDRIRKNKKPKAIIVVDLYGMPANLEKIVSLGRQYDIPVIEDAAEALGSKFAGRSCGTFGTMGILSFNGNKIITTSGGGALIAGDEKFIDQAKFLATQARDNAVHYEHSHVGYNYRMSNILAGIGRGQLEVLDERIAAHRKNNSLYREMLSDMPGICFQNEPGAQYYSNFWLTSILIDGAGKHFSRESIRMKLVDENIDSRPLWKPMHLQPVFKDAPAYINGVSEDLFNKGLCLPSGSGLSEEELIRIAGIIRHQA